MFYLEPVANKCEFILKHEFLVVKVSHKFGWYIKFIYEYINKIFVILVKSYSTYINLNKINQFQENSIIRFFNLIGQKLQSH